MASRANQLAIFVQFARFALGRSPIAARHHDDCCILQSFTQRVCARVGVERISLCFQGFFAAREAMSCARRNLIGKSNLMFSTSCRARALYNCKRVDQSSQWQQGELS
jgi:hypothetical protein